MVFHRLLEDLILVGVDHNMCSRVCLYGQLNRFLIRFVADTRDSSHGSCLPVGMGSHMFDFDGQTEHPTFPALNKAILIIRIVSLQVYSISFLPVVTNFVS